MSMLAEANKRGSGRWVLMPRKDERFMGPRDRTRARMRQRRRQVFTVLLEATIVTLLIGLFPPLHRMLAVTAALGFVLLLYAVMLVNVRLREVERERARRRRTVGGRAMARLAVDARGYAPARVSNGNGNGHSNGSLNGNGHAPAYRAASYGLDSDDQGISEVGVQFIEDDVHVIIRRAREIEEQPLEATV
jgi:hypothetical protein